MKQRLLSLVLTAVMLLSVMMGFAGCSSGDGSISGKVKPDSEEIIGNTEKNGVELVIPTGTFEKAVNVSIGIADEKEIMTEDGASYIFSPIELVSDGGEHTLGETVTVKIKLPKSVTEDDYLSVMGAYYNGESWEYILPDAEALQNGYLQFGTPHFSRYAALKLEKEKALDKYAETLATQNVTGSKPSQELNDCFTEALDKMGFTNETVQGIIMQNIAKELHSSSAFITNAKNGDASGIAGQGAELIAGALLKSAHDEAFVKKMQAYAGSAASGAAAAALSLYDGGSGMDAYKEFVYAAMDVIPTAKFAKAAVEATKAGSQMWQDYSFESAYNVYLKQNIASDGNISADSWETIFFNMGSGLDYMQRDYRTAYANANGKALKELDKDTELRDRLNNQVMNEIKSSFMKRYTNTSEISSEKARIKEMLTTFDQYGLLSWNKLLSFPYEMELATRIDSLMKIRENILDIVGDDRLVFGSSDEVIEGNLAEAIYKWLECGKDRGKFYDWMREKGYLESLGKPAEGGYWQLVRSFENDYEKSKADDAYTESWSGGGSYTYNCKTTFDHHYTGSTHNTCRGEFVNNTGTASAPNSRYAGGEQVKITLTVSAATSSNICFNLGAHLTSCITPVNHNDPFISYGTETYLQNIDDESAKGDVRTYKNDTNTGYIGESVTSGATMPMGYEDGDKVYILIIFTGGNNLIKTAYEYEWHS
ncbi:MAG TPA: hypothetical protein PK629_05880 [Oscillospiraceae bacterium]|nr:hypothetical protein [Oscillospiraceae bacterium]HPF55156.1 hypothetical protein [Clostridiales bacterium]HPK34485.1 hypothetical protein [Oscillospiraceae bacterium]HPR75931.1 hypothetical protein [Oscillospiraceae bacterium]